MPGRVRTRRAIPLNPRRRLIGSAFGGHTSIRRGEGSDVAGSGPYQPGDHIHAIDWKASARLSALRGDRRVHRPRAFAEEMPRAVLVCDRRPEMALFPSDLPWLHKPAAVVRCRAPRCQCAQPAWARRLSRLRQPRRESERGQPFWRPPQRAVERLARGSRGARWTSYLEGGFDAPPDNLERALRFLALVRGSVPDRAASCSSSPTSSSCRRVTSWAAAIGRGWDVVPVIVRTRSGSRASRRSAGLSPRSSTSRRAGSCTCGSPSAKRRSVRRRTRIACTRSAPSSFASAWTPSSSPPPTRCDVRPAFVAWAEHRLLDGGRLG